MFFICNLHWIWENKFRGAWGKKRSIKTVRVLGLALGQCRKKWKYLIYILMDEAPTWWILSESWGRRKIENKPEEVSAVRNWMSSGTNPYYLKLSCGTVFFWHPLTNPDALYCCHLKLLYLRNLKYLTLWWYHHILFFSESRHYIWSYLTYKDIFDSSILL